MKTLVLIDGHALAYRMYFALERTGMKAPNGQPSWAIYGFFNAIFNLITSHQPDAMAMAFDTSRISFRTDLYPEYKAHRAEMPEDLRSQMDVLMEGVGLLNIPLFRVPGVEADDVIGTLSAQASATGEWEVDILTGDQDAFQLIDPDNRVTVLIPGRGPKEGLKRYGWTDVHEKWGVYPDQVIDFKGLKGDTSDNIPGVPGIGDKTAAKLLAEFPHLEAVYDNLPRTGTAKLQEKLTTYREQAFLSKQLATIIRDVPEVSLDLAACHLDLPDPDGLRAYFQRLGFRQFLGQWHQILAPFGVEGHQSDPVATQAAPVTPPAIAPLSPRHPVADYPAFTPMVVHELDALEEFLAQAKTCGVLALDLETTGLDVFTAQPVGIAMATGTGLKKTQRATLNPLGIPDEYPATVESLALSGDVTDLTTVYVPVGHVNSDGQPLLGQLAWETIKPILTPLFQDPELLKIVHNAKYEINVLRQWGAPLAGPVFDTMITSYVCQPERRHGLKALATDLLGLEMAPIETLIGKGRNQIPFSQVPLEQAAPYAALDAHATWCLAHHFLSCLSPEKLALMDELEMPVAHTIAEMEWTGVRLDTDYLANLSQQLAERLTVLEQGIYEAAGEQFNLNSPKQLGEILFVKLGIAPCGKTASKTAYSTDASVLEKLAHEHPIVQQMLDYRQLFKLRSTYIEALPQLIRPQTGRLHTSFNQTITATGRLSSSDPNLQNIPIRTDWGRQIRAAFIPCQPEGEGEPWWLVSADYSQIELRVLAHLSEDPRLLEAFRSGEDIHTATAALVFGVPVGQVTKDQRYQAKAVNFGIVYGQTAHGLSEQLGISRAEAQLFIERYFTTYPGVKRVMEAVKAQAHRDGFVTTLFGRRRDLTEGLNSSNKSVREFAERAAFNTPIQGTAADLMKLAMIRVARRLKTQGLQSRLILQVHDEIVLEVPDDELEAAKAVIQWGMALGQPLRVPLEVDLAVATSWMEA